MKVDFCKMQGLGNDFVVIDNLSSTLTLSSAQIRAISDRRLGVGCDQLLLLEKPVSRNVDFLYRIFNADGTPAEHCGNGVRCLARFVREKSLTHRSEIAFEAVGGRVESRFDVDGQVTVNMGCPVFEPMQVPFKTPTVSKKYSLIVGSQSLTIGVVSMGNPHAVVQVEDVDSASVETLGPAIQGHPSFPKGVNVGFSQCVSRNRLRLRVYERGVGETRACGTGACAAAVIGRVWGMLDEHVYVELTGGELFVSWDGDDRPVWMKGPATTVFEGCIDV